MFLERGFEGDHSTINRWVLAYTRPRSRNGYAGFATPLWFYPGR